jgi:spectinomycin phosphotransferase
MMINEETIPELIKKEYGIPVSCIERLDAGFDRYTHAYKLLSGGQDTFFLKIRSGNFTGSSLAVLSWLSEKTGLPNIIKPVKTLDGKLYRKTFSSCIALFPYIDGRPGWDVSFTKDQLVELGKFMSGLHSADVPNEYKNLIPLERYGQKYNRSVKKYLAGIKNKVYGNPVIMDFLYILKNNEITIRRMIDYLERPEHLESITKKNMKDGGAVCLCHGDIHAGNILVDKNSFFVVDWDTIVLAPKERDLMFIGGGVGNKWNKEEEIEYFYEGYGKSIKIDMELIKYYRYERIIQDIYEFYRQILSAKTGKEKRKACYELFKETFKPNNVVDIALRT